MKATLTLYDADGLEMDSFEEVVGEDPVAEVRQVWPNEHARVVHIYREDGEQFVAHTPHAQKRIRELIVQLDVAFSSVDTVKKIHRELDSL
jgi:hypothetical protein